jgi:type IV pilus assembly protein PilY1
MNMRLNAPVFAGALALLLVLLCPRIGSAQASLFQENFNNGVTVNSWYFFNGACLTAGTSTTPAANPGLGSSCLSIASSYYSGEPLIGGVNGTPGPTQTLPDPSGQGALRLTNGCTQQPDPGLSGPTPCSDGTQPKTAATKTHTYGGGHNQNGAILSAATISSYGGVNITFKTVDYRGDSDGTGQDGADGLGDFGAVGGSLGYTCSNTNNSTTARSDGTLFGFDGIVGGYIGLGIDEYGNGMNGTANTLGETDYVTNSNGTPYSPGDNTASGGYYKPGRIGIRGAGNIAWKWLNTNQAANYPSSLATTLAPGSPINGVVTTLAAQAVQNTCSTGYYWNYSLPTPKQTTTPAPDYPAIAWKTLTSLQLANESAIYRGSTTTANTDPKAAYPITYSLQITKDNLLSLAYSYNGGAYQPVISGQVLQNGPIPSTYRFGFAASTGGGSNIHEIMCFAAGPNGTSASSGGVNVYQNPTVRSGTQLYLANYFPNPGDWTGQLTAQAIGFSTATNTVVVATTPTWDARCVLTGVSSTTTPCSTGVTNMAAEPPTSTFGANPRVILTWSGSGGIPFEWGSLTTAQQNALTSGDTTVTDDRWLYLRGDRTNEISSTGTCPQLTKNNLPCFRQRSSVLSDIVDSSPTWVGPPQTYASTVTFNDQLITTDTPTESSYAGFASTNAGRLNVVYVGANDGMLHGFRSGSLDSNGNLVNNTSTPNDGYEVLAYMPNAVIQTIHSATGELDYANTQFAHNWYVDSTPATGDLYYAGAWHTWVVSGLGQGGAAIFALDVTNPANFGESTAAAANTVIGEWTTTLACANSTVAPSCGKNLGNTYGTPLIRRFHNGSWGVIFGNGYGSSTNAAGIYIMLVNSSTGAKSFYYLGTPSTGSTPNGIANPASLDLDLDHIVDYIYAGDLHGNVWRFDVTSATPASWALSGSAPLFTAPVTTVNGVSTPTPITAGLAVSTLRAFDLTALGGEQVDTTKPARVIVNFGTGQEIPQSLTLSAQYASGTQYLFGIWDANFNAQLSTGQLGWNQMSSTLAVAPGAPQTTVMTTVSMATLTQQTISTVTQAAPALSYRTVSQTPVCWAIYEALDATSGCSATVPGTQYGWYMILPGTSEQILYDPVISPDGELVVNTYIPAVDSPLLCTPPPTSTGFSMAVQPADGWGGNGLTGYFTVTNTNSSTSGADGIQLNGTGIPSFLSSGQSADHNAQYLITQTSGGPATPQKTNRHTIVSGKRLNWTQRR